MSKGAIICLLLQELYGIKNVELLLEQDPGRVQKMRLYSYGHAVIWVVEQEAPR